MLNWNVLINVHEHSFSRAFLLLEELGNVYQGDFENLLLMKVDSIPVFLETFNDQLLKEPNLANLTSRIVPVTTTFSFQSATEFETKAKERIINWLPNLAGKKFLVRMHRRGFKDIIDCHNEENFLEQIVLQELEAMGNPGQIDREDPDALIVVETLAQQAGLSYWTRQDLQKYPWLKLF
jgi:tRNA(Ser,Leu) C12 N-acetylase TAN1